MTFFFRDDTVRVQAVKAKSALKKAFIDRSKSDVEFLQSLTTTTKSKRATAVRFCGWAEELSKATGVTVPSPPSFVELLAK